MAIIIPSKNIYEIDNPKIRDNIIDNVSIEQTVITPNNDYETPIHNEKIYISDNDLVNGQEQSPSISAYSSNYEIYDYPISFALAYFSQPKYISIDLQIPILKNNKYISKIIDGVDDNNNSNIKYSLYGDIEEGTTTATVSNVSWSNVNNNTSLLNTATITIDYQNASKTIIEDTNYTISNKIETTGLVTVVGGYNASATSILETEENIKEKLFTLSNDGNYYVGNLKILCGIIEIYSRAGNSDSYNPTSFTASPVYYKKYTPKQIEITIYGNTIGIDLTNNSVTYGSGKNPHSLSGNELLQSNGKVGNTNLTEYLANNVLNQYANGKETATLLCSISDYYTDDNIPIIISNNVYMIGESDFDYHVENLEIGEDDNGIMQYNHLAIIRLHKPATTNILFMVGYIYIEISIGSIENTYSYIDDNSNTPEFLENIEIVSQVPKMVFEKGDDVIPYFYGADGKDRPMSKNKDGSAKVFEVVGSNIIYDGAVWQELTLLEKTQNN